MKRGRLLARVFCLLLLIPMAYGLIGCTSSGGSDGDGAGAKAVSNIQISTAGYNFGTISIGETSAPYTVTISNNGGKELNVSGMVLSNDINFSLDFKGHFNACGSESPTIAAGGSCAVEVRFRPDEEKAYDETLTISSDDPDTPDMVVKLKGEGVFLQVAELVFSPSGFDFGSVTVGNSIPLAVTIANNGPVDLDISDLQLSDIANFLLDENAGTNPCGAAPLTLQNNDSCTVEISFMPQGEGQYSATFDVTSNDPDSPNSMALAGVGELIASLNVIINQIKSDCPEITIYVSVTDQTGFPITDLEESNFTVFENGTQVLITDFAFIKDIISPIAAAVVMDYSGSMENSAINAMEIAAKNFVDLMGNDDEAEVIKFAETVEVFQPFTSNKFALKAAIDQEYTSGRKRTRLFDAIWKALDDTASIPDKRSAVIVLTDGDDDDSEDYDLTDVIAKAVSEGIPVYTIGLGDDISQIDLTQLAEETGGQFFLAPTPDQLQSIYRKISLLLENEYLITYESVLQGGLPATLQVQVIDNPLKATSGPRDFMACP